MEVDSFDPKGKKFLAISAHPDDACFWAGGTLLKWVAEGAKGAVVICTNGDKGSNDEKLTSEDIKSIRSIEQAKIGKMLQLEETWFLDYPDAHLEVTQELKNKLVKIIRSYKPDIVLTFDPATIYSERFGFVNHPDHRATGQAALDCVYPMARDYLNFPEHLSEGLSPHCVRDLFLYNCDKPNYYIDVSNTLEEKFKLMDCHESQFDMTKIRPLLTERAELLGKQAGVKAAESFIYLHLD